MNAQSIRGIITAIAGLATALGVIPSGVEAVIVENATLAVGALATLWGAVATVLGTRRAVQG